MTFKAVYSRHGEQYFEEHETLDAAIRELSVGAEFGELYQICIVEPDGKVLTCEQIGFIDITDEIPGILKALKIPFTGERGTFKLIEVTG